MAKKPKAPTSASWDVYKIAKKATLLGTVEAPDKQAAVEKAAQVQSRGLVASLA